MGALEETAKAAGGVVDALRGSPVALAMGIMNIALLLFLFYYLSRITQRTETTVQALFTSQDKLFTQWGVIVKDTNELTEKTMHCMLPEDVIKLMNVPRFDAPQRPVAPEPLKPHSDNAPKLNLPPPHNEHAEKSMLFLPPAPPLTEPVPSEEVKPHD